MRKLLFFHHYNSPLGAGLSFLHILQSIDRSENEVVVCLPKIDGNLHEKILSMGIRIVYSNAVIPYMHFNGSNMQFFSKRNFTNCANIYMKKNELSRVIRDEAPDCVIVNSLTLFWIGKIAKQLDSKTICFHRETYDHGLFGFRSTLMKKQLAKSFDAIAFLSNFDLMSTPVGSGKYIRITDKVDIEAYQKLSKSECRKKLLLPQKEKLVLYVGGISSLKGPLIAINAIKWVDGVKLIFLQYDSKKPRSVSERIKYVVKIFLNKNTQYKIERLVNKETLKDRVILRPATDKVEEYFIACDAVVFPSMQAHQARPIYEAGVSKKPIAITDFVNTKEFLDSTNGWLFKKGNARSLAKKIEEMLSENAGLIVEENYKRSISTNDLKMLPGELKSLFEMVFAGDNM